MTWLNEFYLSDNIKDSRNAIKRKINWNADILEYYLLAFSKDKNDIRIIPALEFKNLPSLKKNNLIIVGVSSGYHNAIKLADRFEQENISFC